MHAAELDTIYTSLANAVQSSGSRSELFLAMLSLRLIARLGDGPASLAAIEHTLAELAAHDGPPADAPGGATIQPRETT